MSDFNIAVTVIGLGCLAMLYFAHWWNKHQDHKHKK